MVLISARARLWRLVMTIASSTTTAANSLRRTPVRDQTARPHSSRSPLPGPVGQLPTPAEWQTATTIFGGTLLLACLASNGNRPRRRRGYVVRGRREGVPPSLHVTHDRFQTWRLAPWIPSQSDQLPYDGLCSSRQRPQSLSFLSSTPERPSLTSRSIQFPHRVRTLPSAGNPQRHRMTGPILAGPRHMRIAMDPERKRGRAVGEALFRPIRAATGGSTIEESARRPRSRSRL